MKTIISLLILINSPSVFASWEVIKLEGTLQEARKPGAPTSFAPTVFKVGDEIKSGARIHLLENSSAVIKSKKIKAAIRLNSGTTATVNEKSVDIHNGGVLTHFAPKQKVPFTVRTPAAVIGVRGTSFFAQSLKGEDDYVCGCEGKIALKAKKAKKEEIIQTQAHEFPKRISANGQVAATNEAVGHSQAQIDELKSLLSN